MCCWTARDSAWLHQRTWNLLLLVFRVADHPPHDAHCDTNNESNAWRLLPHIELNHVVRACAVAGRPTLHHHTQWCTNVVTQSVDGAARYVPRVALGS
eukprot:CAMPEP_0204254218 /NCGR_PEP_ID=MMETSP0468-20130131/2419_1 /ASSEMBLY_ACC=CAM_ASM_000383 /TAXON_ID=2969 /ORGANISM="Oxyrrhis marina" /LENGTH=97 /DNA_ID=CAMNT_0051227935 /DNA_START=431 /DNA_END=724 /DNA_ORIENTATION=-